MSISGVLLIFGTAERRYSVHFSHEMSVIKRSYITDSQKEHSWSAWLCALSLLWWPITATTNVNSLCLQLRACPLLLRYQLSSSFNSSTAGPSCYPTWFCEYNCSNGPPANGKGGGHSAQQGRGMCTMINTEKQGGTPGIYGPWRGTVTHWPQCYGVYSLK